MELPIISLPLLDTITNLADAYIPVTIGGITYRVSLASLNTLFEDNIMTRRGTVNLTSGAESGTVVFATPMDNPPGQVLVTPRKPTAGAANLIVEVVGDSITANGFNYELPAGAPAAGYKFDYVAL